MYSMIGTLYTEFLTSERLQYALPRLEGYSQPICSFYHKRIFSEISNQIEKNELSLNCLIDSIKTDYIDMDNYKKEFLNMNTQQKYNELIDSMAYKE